MHSPKSRDPKAEVIMTIELNHTIVPARDKVAAATFFAKILGRAHPGIAYGWIAMMAFDASGTISWKVH
jgi:hypothetical protein